MSFRIDERYTLIKTTDKIHDECKGRINIVKTPSGRVITECEKCLAWDNYKEAGT